MPKYKITALSKASADQVRKIQKAPAYGYQRV